MLAIRKKILSSDYFKSVFRLTMGSLIAQLITALVSQFQQDYIHQNN